MSSSYTDLFISSLEQFWKKKIHLTDVAKVEVDISQISCSFFPDTSLESMQKRVKNYGDS